MISKRMVHGTWHEFVGRLRAKWGQLNADDLENFRGNLESLVGYIERRTGEAPATIMRFLEDLLADGSHQANRLAGLMRDYASQAAETARHGFQSVASRARHSYEGAEHFVQHRPATSVGAAFAAGALFGFVLAMMLGEN